MDNDVRAAIGAARGLSISPSDSPIVNRFLDQWELIYSSRRDLPQSQYQAVIDGFLNQWEINFIVLSNYLSTDPQSPLQITLGILREIRASPVIVQEQSSDTEEETVSGDTTPTISQPGTAGQSTAATLPSLTTAVSVLRFILDRTRTA